MPYITVGKEWRDLCKLGEDEQKLNAVILWRDMPFFTSANEQHWPGQRR
jgi:hypothetical protein